MIQREVVVVGAGPAGLSAAIASAKAGADVLLLDENERPGGQLFKQIHKFFGSGSHRAGMRGFEIGYRLLEEAREAGVEAWLNTMVWGLFPEHRLGILHEGRSSELQAKQLVIATGAMENAISFQGWTLPGVMTAGAAQTLINIHRVRPGRRALVVGAGNVGLIVAHQLLQAGMEVAAVVESRPTIGGYGVHASKVRRAGVPILTSHTVLEASGKQQVQQAVITRVDRHMQLIDGSETTLEVDSILLAVGLTPLAELAALAGCRFTYIPHFGGHVPLHDAHMQTTVPGLYVAGDVTGIEEASAAMEEGQIAGTWIAAHLGCLSRDEAHRQIEQARKRLGELQQGQFGDQRARAKAWQLQVSAGKSRTVGQQNDERTANGQDARDEGTKDGVTHTGVVSQAELRTSPAQPTPERLRRGPIAIIECLQDIPCNPCEAACPHGAIIVGEPITNLPRLREDVACTGCGLCIAACPGLAIFVIDAASSKDEALVSLPYEYQPLPSVGASVDATDREGNVVTQGRITRVWMLPSFHGTAVVTLAVPQQHLVAVRGFRQRT
jgi:thioredoxin reductase/Fe-S-cluster-containing hydrogenase component 2